MSLYINEKGKEIFKNSQVTAPNQSYYQSDQRAELLQRQQRQAETIQQLLTDLKTRQMDSSRNWHHMHEMLQTIKQESESQRSVNDMIFREIRENKGLTQTALGKEEETKQAIMQELAQVRKSCQHLAAADEQHREATSALVEKCHTTNHTVEATQIMQEQTLAELAVQYEQAKMLQEQLQSQTDLLKAHMQNQEKTMELHAQNANRELAAKQEEISERMENQEAVIEKMLRQVNSLRAIIYERSNDLAAKMEEGFRLTSAFAYHLLTRKGPPITMVTKEKSRQP